MKRLATATAVLIALLATSVAFAATTLSGTYTTKITGKGANTLKGVLDGTWKISIKNGKYTVKVNGKAVVNGAYKIAGSTISLTDKGGSGACSGTGKYKFTIKNSKVTFKKVSDSKSCQAREAVLAHTFSKSSGSLPPQGY